jgi:hypothetical protein
MALVGYLKSILSIQSGRGPEGIRTFKFPVFDKSNLVLRDIDITGGGDTHPLKSFVPRIDLETASAPLPEVTVMQKLVDQLEVFNNNFVDLKFSLARLKFTGLTKDVYTQMNLMGGLEEYMNKMHKGHTVTSDTFRGLEKGSSIKYYQILDRELIRLASPLHKLILVHLLVQTSLHHLNLQFLFLEQVPMFETDWRSINK